MKIISHRGNVNGPIPEKENRPSYIDCAIQLGYEVEADIRFINGEFWLGHDFPQYKIELSWMLKRAEYIWFHCKNKESANNLNKINSNFKFFCHNGDDFTLTSTHHLWVHNLKSNLTKNDIIPMINLSDINTDLLNNVYGICTDFIFEIEKNKD